MPPTGRACFHASSSPRGRVEDLSGRRRQPGGGHVTPEVGLADTHRPCHSLARHATMACHLRCSFRGLCSEAGSAGSDRPVVTRRHNRVAPHRSPRWRRRRSGATRSCGPAVRPRRPGPWCCADRARTCGRRPSRTPRSPSARRSRPMTVAFTASPMCTLSARIAFIRPRWYCITGHWPVVKACDLAQPRPSRIDSEPIFAASSTAPGSPVTYRPGMPSAPPAAVISISEFSTVAGASVAGVCAVPARLEPDGVDAAVNLGNAEDLSRSDPAGRPWRRPPSRSRSSWPALAVPR